MKPSQFAIDIRNVHRAYKAAIGTDQEGAAYERLGEVVRMVKELTGHNTPRTSFPAHLRPSSHL